MSERIKVSWKLNGKSGSKIFSSNMAAMDFAAIVINRGGTAHSTLISSSSKSKGMARQKRRKKRTVSGSIGKVHWKGKTKSGKGRVMLSTKGKTSIKKTVTPYRTRDGKRRLLVVTRTRKIVK